MKKDKLTFGIILSVLFLLIVGVTYAYFALVVTGNDTASDIVIEMGELSLTYSDGTQIIGNQIEPGWTQTKTVTVTNNGSTGTVYKMYYATLLNEIYGQDSSTSNSEIHISATCMSSEDTYCDGIEEKSVTYSNTETTNQVIKEDIYIAPGETQTYEIKFKFVNTNYNQNYNQGKSFYAQINVGDDTTMYNVNVTAYEGEDLIENFNYEMHSTPRSGSTTTGTFTENNVELGSHTVTLTSGSDVYSGSFDLRTSENKGQYSLTAYAEEGTDTADIILYFNEDKELESVEIDDGEMKRPLKPIAGTLASNWKKTVGYETSTGQLSSFGSKVQSITFYGDGRIYEDITPIDVSSTKNGSILLYQEESIECDQTTSSGSTWTTPSICYNVYIVADGRIDFPSNSNSLFANFANANRIDFNYSVNASHVTNMDHLFSQFGYHAKSLTITDVSDWDTSNVTSMKWTFFSAGQYAQTFNIGNLSKWDTSNVEDMRYMFCNAGDRSTNAFDIGNLSNWNTSKVTKMVGMFDCAARSASSWYIGDLSDWDTSKVTTMSSMFEYAGGNSNSTWNIGDISKWDTSSVTDMSSMFRYANKSYVIDLRGWNVQKVTSRSNFNYRSTQITAPRWVN